MASDGWPSSQHHAVVLGGRHTKFSPDWCFSLLKQRFWRTKVGCLDDIIGVVNTSAKVNVAQLVGTQEGENLVLTYNWTGMFAGSLRNLQNLKAQRHFRFDATTPGVVYTEVASDATEESMDLLVNRDWAPSRSTLPPLIPPNGLSQEGQRYLHDTIQEYFPEEVRDRVCPVFRQSAPPNCILGWEKEGGGR